MDNLKIWNKALDAETIQKNVPSFFLEQEMEAIKAEIADVTLENGQSVLPDYGGTVTWKSEMDAVVIGEDGLDCGGTGSRSGRGGILPAR